MFKRLVCLTVILLSSQYAVFAAQHNLKGRVTDSLQTAIAGVSISLLDPNDSTLVAFGIADEHGSYTIAAVKEGKYLLQIAMMGYYTFYQHVEVGEATAEDLGVQVLYFNEQSTALEEVIISAERVPVRLKGDTLEYNAGSFKVKPDAVVEDLLKKMPGMQVDKNGNIKSMGKEVGKILVDGKEFFGDDPKVATKNLPADAVEKIQSFEKKSDGSLFSGIDDGEREQTLNVVLKEGKKSGYFGEAKAGIGIPGQYEGLLKAFKFKQKSQFATMGMFNNVNKFGFSFEDYFNFSGGLKAFSGGEIRIDSDEMPVDLGQPVTGDVNSGALTMNYMLEPNKRNRITLNYMGNGMKKLLKETASTRNFINDGSFDTQQSEEEKSNNLVNRASLKWRRETAVSSTNFNIYGLLKNNDKKAQSFTENYSDYVLTNQLNNNMQERGRKAELAGDLSWMQKLKGKWPVLKASMQGHYKDINTKEQWHNRTVFDNPFSEVNNAQRRNIVGSNTSISGSASAVRTLGKGHFLEPMVRVAMITEANKRIQGSIEIPETITDSLSPSFEQKAWNVTTELALKKMQTRQRWGITVKRGDLWLNPTISGQQLYLKHYAYFLPAFFWEREIKAGARLNLSYKTEVTAPSAAQLLPTIDYSNPLMLTKGNTNLVPEYRHTGNASYISFDQYNMGTFSMSLSGNYTQDNIAFSRTISSDLIQQLDYVNTPYEVSAQLDLGYSRPIKSIGISIDARVNETWAQSIIPVNTANNRNSTITHNLELNFSNINSDIWDFRWGGAVKLSDSRYSLHKEMDSRYNNYSGFVQIGYRPNVKWNISTSGDITHYTARSFDQSLTIPLVSAELSRYIFANQRGCLTLRAFDLLDKNKAVQRISQLNYITERRSNTIGRYIMFSFSYRLNRSGQQNSISIKS